MAEAGHFSRSGHLNLNRLNESLPAQLWHGYGQIIESFRRSGQELTKRESGTLLARTDIHIEVHRMAHNKLNTRSASDLIYSRLTVPRSPHSLDYIIEHLPEGELRASYVELPEKGRLLINAA